MECKKYNFVEEFKDINTNDTEFLKKCLKINQDIKLRQHTLVNFIEDLGVFLVDRSPGKRQYGVQILTTVLENLEEGFLTSIELDYIAAFYGDRLKDHSQVIPPTLRGILALVKSKHVTSEAVSNLFSHLEINVSCQQQQLSDRRIIYGIFEEFFNKHHTEMLPTMNDKLLTVIMESMDGERDPRLLLYLFGWLPKLLRVADLKNLKEQMFEILACYFPVDFKAPPQDPNAISRQELSDALSICLCATPFFTEFCIPLALEKLDSSMQTAKIDSLKLIERGCQTFRYDLVMACQIWEAIKEEIFNTKDSEVQTTCWGALSALFQNMLHTRVNQDYDEFLSCVIVSTRKYLVPSVPNFPAATRILLCLSIVSDRTCEQTFNDIVPILLNTYNLVTKISEKIQVMNALVEFVVVAKAQKLCTDFKCSGMISNIVTICLEETNTTLDMKINTFRALTRILHALPNDIKPAVFDLLTAFITVRVEVALRTEILKCLEQCYVCYPTEIGQRVMCDVLLTNDSALKLYFEALCVLLPHPQSDVVMDAFLPYLTEDAVETVAMAVESLTNVLKRDEVSDELPKMLSRGDLVHKLIKWTILNLSQLSGSEQDAKLVNCVSYIISYIMGSQSSQVQNQMYHKEIQHIQQCKTNKCVYVALLTGLNLRLKSEVVLNYRILDELIKDLGNVTNCDYAEYAVRLIANMLNKCTKDDVLEYYLQKLNNLVNTNLSNSKDVFITANLVSWVTKALAQRYHPDFCIWLDKMINLVTQHEETAKAFKVVLDDGFDELNEKSYCIKRLLYRQRFFIVACEKLSALYDISSATSLLMAFSYLWFNAPPQAIMLQFEKSTKFTLLCLEKCQEADVLCRLLVTLKLVIVNQCTTFSEHMEDFLQRILKLTRFESSMKVRIAALQCLQHFTSKFPVYKLLPHKRHVLDILGECIDDRKRMVRKEAVITRSIWFLVDMET